MIYNNALDLIGNTPILNLKEADIQMYLLN